MEKQLTKELKKAIETLDKKFSKDKLYEKFEKSSTEFDLMVEKGFAKKRGKHSFSLLDSSSTKVTFNI
jgi:hypothetical protein